MLLLRLLLLAIPLLAEQRHIVVIAHRGEHLHHEENTLAAFQGAVDAGADYFETDVRTTSDGKLVLMHDATVNRTTKGTGAIAEMTFEAVRKLGVPTFDEALAFARGKIGIYVDSKGLSAADAIAAIERHAMQEHVVIYGGPGYLKEISRLRPDWKVMPEARSPSTLAALLPLKVAAFDHKDFNDETIAVALKAGVAIYVDRLGPLDNPGSWQDAIDRGASGIQTDHPAELVSYLKSKGYR